MQLKLVIQNAKFTEVSRNLLGIFSRFLKIVAALFKQGMGVSVAAWGLAAERSETVLF